MSKMDELFELLTHIDIEHERELDGPYNFTRLRAIHKDMHDRSDHWNHGPDEITGFNLTNIEKGN